MDRGEPLPEHVTAYVNGVLYLPGISKPSADGDPADSDSLPESTPGDKQEAS